MHHTPAVHTTTSRRPLRWLLPLLPSLLIGCGSQPPPVDPYTVNFDCETHAQISVADTRRMKPAALDSTLMVLGDEQRTECWLPAIRVLGQIGDERAVSSLTALVGHYGARMSTTWEVALVTESFDTLGRLASRGVGQPAGEGLDEGVADQAVHWLIQSADPVAWTKRAMKWTSGLRQRQLIGQLTRTAVKVLGRTDHRLAREHLRRMSLAQAEVEAYRFAYDTADTTATHPSGLFTLHPLPPGRISLAMKEMAKLKAGCDGVPLQEQAEKLRVDAHEAWRRERAWLASRKEQRTFVLKVREADTVADRRLGGFNLQLQSLFSLRDSDEDHRGLNQIREVLFPKGARSVARAPRDVQWEAVLERVKVLEKRHGDLLQSLGLSAPLSKVRLAHEALRDALDTRWKGEPVEAVLDVRRQLQLRLHRVVAGILTCHGGETEDDVYYRGLLLGAVLDQDTQVANYLRRQEPVRDLDPDTRQEVTPIEEMGPPPPSVIEEPGDAEPIPGLEGPQDDEPQQAATERRP